MKEGGRKRAPCMKNESFKNYHGGIKTSRSNEVSKRKEEMIATAQSTGGLNHFPRAHKGHQRRKHLTFPWKPHFFIFRCVMWTSSQRRRCGRAGILGRQLTWPEISLLHRDEVKSNLERWQTQQPSRVWGCSLYIKWWLKGLQSINYFWQSFGCAVIHLWNGKCTSAHYTHTRLKASFPFQVQKAALSHFVAGRLNLLVCVCAKDQVLHYLMGLRLQKIKFQGFSMGCLGKSKPWVILAKVHWSLQLLTSAKADTSVLHSV